MGSCRGEIVARRARLRRRIGAPVRPSTRGRGLRTEGPADGGSISRTNGPIEPTRCIWRPEPFHRPKIPAARRASAADRAGPRPRLPHVRQLPPGGVLIVGSGQTGVPARRRAHEAGRQVVLSVGRCGRVPRRYRGHDIFRWLRAARRAGPGSGRTSRRSTSCPIPGPVCLQPAPVRARRRPRHEPAPDGRGRNPAGRTVRGRRRRTRQVRGRTSRQPRLRRRVLRRALQAADEGYVGKAGVDGTPTIDVAGIRTPGADRARPAARRDLDGAVDHRLRPGLRGSTCRSSTSSAPAPRPWRH